MVIFSHRGSDKLNKMVQLVLEPCSCWWCHSLGYQSGLKRKNYSKPVCINIETLNWKWLPCLQPGLPSSVDPQELTYLDEERCYNIPDGVRPVLKTFRIEVSHICRCWHVAVVCTCTAESLSPLLFASVCVCVQVLFWGLRELKRVELFEVSRPLVRMECAGQQLESEEIENFKGHPNFKEMVRYIDVVSFSNRWWLLTLLMAIKVHRSKGTHLYEANFLFSSFPFMFLIQSGTARADLPPPSSDNIRGGTSGIWSPGSGWVQCGPEPHGLCSAWAQRGAPGGRRWAKTKTKW